MTATITDLKIFSFETDADAIATITWDTPEDRKSVV